MAYRDTSDALASLKINKKYRYNMCVNFPVLQYVTDWPVLISGQSVYYRYNRLPRSIYTGTLIEILHVTLIDYLPLTEAGIMKPALYQSVLWNLSSTYYCSLNWIALPNRWTPLI